MKKLLLCATILCIPAAFAAPLCVTGTLAQFISQGSCVFPANNGLMFSGWSAASTNGVNPTAVTLTPTSDTTGTGFVVSAPLASSGTGSLTLSFDYVVSGISITQASGAIAGFGTAPGNAPGAITATKSVCEGAAFSGTTCPGTETTITLNSTSSSGKINFNGSGFATLGIADSVTVTGNAAVSFLDNAFIGTGNGTGTGGAVPEPSSLLLLGSGLVLVALKFVRKEARR